MRYPESIRQVIPEKGASHIVTTGGRPRQRPPAMLMPLWQFAFCCLWSSRELIAINTTAYTLFQEALSPLHPVPEPYQQ